MVAVIYLVTVYVESKVSGEQVKAGLPGTV